MNTLIQDLKYAFRQLLKSPGFTIIAVLTLAIGIGANVGSYSIMDAVVLRPLAVPELNHVVTLYEQQDRKDPQQVALANFEDWRRQSSSFESLAIRGNADMSLTGAGDAAHVRAELTSPSFFTVMRTGAFLGRVFDDSETQPGRNTVAVLSYPFWKSRLAADPNVLGRTIQLDQKTYTVIGVMPKTMQFPSQADIFLPFAPTPAQLNNRASHDYLVIGRLNKGVSVGQAQAELNVLAGHLAELHPATNQGWSVKVETLLADMNGDLTPLYFNLVQGATLFVLLVVCANIANLQFARGIARRPELAMRTALGAGRGRLLRQLLTENILLGLIGGVVGLLFALGYMHVSQANMPEKVARFLAGWSNITLSGRALALSFGLAITAGIISGFAPALEAMRINLVEQLKSGSRAVTGASRSRKLRNILAVAQIALAMALVVGAALMCKGMLSMLHLGDQYRPQQTLIFNVHLPATRFDTSDKLAAWYDSSLERLRALPGVDHAALTGALPYSDDGWLDGFQIENRPVNPASLPSALRLTVSPSYFAAFGIRLAPGQNSGRLFTSRDDLHSPPSVVVSQSFASRYFPSESPLGHRLRMGTTAAEQTQWMTIVGVVQEANYALWERSRPAAIYMNTAQLPPAAITYTLTTSGDARALASAARKAIAALDPTLPLDGVESYSQFLHERLAGLFYVAAMLGMDALIALLLAAIGIFGVMANLVGERTREIGVRLALGARREDVLRMVLRRAGWLTGAGVGVGLLLAFALAHGVANLLYGVSPNDPIIFGGITAIVTAVAILASWLPAIRAARIDPMEALRDE